MRNFTYRKAQSIEDAVVVVAAGAVPVAGGTELLNWMRLGAEQPEKVIDISGIENLRTMDFADGKIRMGSLVTLNQVEGHELVRQHAPVLAQACLRAASAQIRNSATMGGNLLQKTRCPYFRVEAGNETRLPWACNKRQPGSGCSALNGQFDRASIFGATDTCLCNHPSDPATALAALDADIHLVGPDGKRTIPATEFHLTQQEARDLIADSTAEGLKGYDGTGTTGEDALLVNRLRRDEIITGYSFAVDASTARSHYLKVRERQSYEYAMVSAAVCLDMDGSLIRSVRIALGSIAQKPWRLKTAEDKLVGAKLTVEGLTSALDEEFRSATPVKSQEYKPKLARNTARRAILLAGGKDDA